jgi:adenosine deaminase CECR1
MIGRKDMTLFGWKQLIEWSIKHACMSPAEQQDVRRVWNAWWERFLDEVIEELGQFDIDAMKRSGRWAA